LRRFFQKATAVKGAQPLSPVATGETLLPRFFLLAFSLRVLPAKKKRLTVALNFILPREPHKWEFHYKNKLLK